MESTSIACYKGTFSVVALIVVNRFYNILAVKTRGKGRFRDSGLHRISSIKTFLDNNLDQFPHPEELQNFGLVHYHILADDYICRDRSYKLKQLSVRRKLHFNKCFSAAERIVESVFGILTSRFRVLNRPHGNSENVKLIIESKMVLHNLLLQTVTTEELLTRFPPDHVNQELNKYSRAESRPEDQLERIRLMEHLAT